MLGEARDVLAVLLDVLLLGGELEGHALDLRLELGMLERRRGRRAPRRVRVDEARDDVPEVARDRRREGRRAVAERVPRGPVGRERRAAHELERGRAEREDVALGQVARTGSAAGHEIVVVEQLLAHVARVALDDVAPRARGRREAKVAQFVAVFACVTRASSEARPARPLAPRGARPPRQHDFRAGPRP